jgi:transcriptional regulator with XRE-family HTH domain
MARSAPEVAAEFDVGERLRTLRRFRRCTLQTVAARSGLSESFLSQVERGRSNASIASLRRIADALGVTMADLFEPEAMPGPKVLKSDDRPALQFGILGRKLLLTPRPLHHLEVFQGELEVGGSTGEEPYAHGDSE